GGAAPVGRERMATTFSWVRWLARSMPWRPWRGTCHRGALMPPPLVFRACPGQTGGIVPHSGQAAYWVIKGDSKLTLQFGNICRSCRSGRTHRRKGHGVLLHEFWILWPLPRESESGSLLACVHQRRTVSSCRGG